MVAGTHKIHLKTGAGHPADTRFQGQISINIQVIGRAGGADTRRSCAHPGPGHVPTIGIGNIDGHRLVGGRKRIHVENDII